jgi:streptomycin 6-kinase
MPDGKPSGIRCVQLTEDNRCRLFGQPERPAVCVRLKPEQAMCGDNAEQALQWLYTLEVATRPSPTHGIHFRSGDMQLGSIELPDDFLTRLRALHGERAARWLVELPRRLRSLAERWDLELGGPLSPPSYSLVLGATRSGGLQVVLKLIVPGRHLRNELICLQAYAGHGIPDLLAHDEREGAILLERILPGSDLRPLPEAEAIGALTALMGRLHRAQLPATGLPTVADWGQGFDRHRTRLSRDQDPLPQDLLDHAELTFDRLTGSMQGSVLLHGDLHHMNVLASEAHGWQAIDPQGVIGEPAYELGAFLRNPMPALLSWQGLGQVLAQRVALMAEATGIDRQRIVGWGLAQAVLSAIWSLEDEGSGWRGAVQVAGLLQSMMG